MIREQYELTPIQVHVELGQHENYAQPFFFNLSFSGVMYRPLHHRWRDMDKTEALKIQKGNFDKALSLSSESIADLNWWCKSISTAYNPISHGASQLNMTTGDASVMRWGCSL